MTTPDLGKQPRYDRPSADGGEKVALDSAVVVTKFDPSPQRARLIVRPHLTEALDGQMAARLTLLVAPAGYGKTTVLADWRRQLKDRGHVVGWLSLDEDDSDVPHVLRCLALALARAGMPKAAKLATSMVSDPTAAKPHLASLLNVIAAEERDTVLILDEFEHLPDMVVEEVFAPCLEKAPPNLHLVIASREMPPLRIANLRAQGLVHEIHAEDLRFSLSEIHSLFGDAATGNELKVLEAQTSGWPVAVQLFRGAWGRHDRRGQILHAIESLDQTLTDYLSEQVFSSLPGALFELLVRVSPLDRLSPGIMEFITGSDSAWPEIMQSDVLAPFLIPLDTKLKVYRMHPLIRAYFRSHLDDRPGADRAPVYRRAAQWYATAGRLVSALGCAAAAKDTELAGRLVEEAGGLTIWLRAGLPRLKAIIETLDETVFSAFPRVKLLKAFLHIKEGKITESRRLFEAIRKETGGFEQDRKGGDPSLLKLESLVLETTLMVNECQTPSDRYLAEYERTILSISEDDDVFLGNVKNRLAISHCQRGHFGKALREAAESLDHYRQAGLIHGEFFAHLHMGAAYFAQGRAGKALESYTAARELWRNALDEEKTKQALLQAYLQELCYERAEKPLSMRRLTETRSVFEHCEWWYDAFAAAVIPLIMTQLSAQGLDAALAEIETCRKLAKQRHAPGLLPLLDAVEVSCLALSDEIVRAREKMTACGFSPDDFSHAANEEMSWRQGEAVATAIARVYIRDGGAKAAVEFLGPVVEHYVVRSHVRSAIRLGLLRAIALQVSGDTERARDALAKTVTAAARSGYARAFAEEGKLAVELLEHHLPHLRPEIPDAAFLDRLSAIAKGAGAGAEKPVLSERELAVMHHVAQGLTDKEIARELDLTPNTVKFHLKNIFRKLGARNRAQAVNYGQAQGLIA